MEVPGVAIKIYYLPPCVVPSSPLRSNTGVIRGIPQIAIPGLGIVRGPASRPLGRHVGLPANTRGRLRPLQTSAITPFVEVIPVLVRHATTHDAHGAGVRLRVLRSTCPGADGVGLRVVGVLATRLSLSHSSLLLPGLSFRRAVSTAAIISDPVGDQTEVLPKVAIGAAPSVLGVTRLPSRLPATTGVLALARMTPRKVKARSALTIVDDAIRPVPVAVPATPRATRRLVRLVPHTVLTLAVTVAPVLAKVVACRPTTPVASSRPLGTLEGGTVLRHVRVTILGGASKVARAIPVVPIHEAGRPAATIASMTLDSAPVVGGRLGRTAVADAETTPTMVDAGVAAIPHPDVPAPGLLAILASLLPSSVVHYNDGFAQFMAAQVAPAYWPFRWAPLHHTVPVMPEQRDLGRT